MTNKSLRCANLCRMAVFNLIDKCQRHSTIGDSIFEYRADTTYVNRMLLLHFDKLSFDDHCLIMERIDKLPTEARRYMRRLIAPPYMNLQAMFVDGRRYSDVRLSLFIAHEGGSLYRDYHAALARGPFYYALANRTNERRYRAQAALHRSLIVDLINIVTAY